jgi:hypothetical protein
LLAQTDNDADDFAVKAGRDFVLVDDFHGPIDEHGDDGFFDGVGVGAGHKEFLGDLRLFAEVDFGDGRFCAPGYPTLL